MHTQHKYFVVVNKNQTSLKIILKLSKSMAGESDVLNSL